MKENQYGAFYNLQVCYTNYRTRWVFQKRKTTEQQGVSSRKSSECYLRWLPTKFIGFAVCDRSSPRFEMQYWTVETRKEFWLKACTESQCRSAPSERSNRWSRREYAKTQMVCNNPRWQLNMVLFLRFFDYLKQLHLVKRILFGLNWDWISQCYSAAAYLLLADRQHTSGDQQREEKVFEVRRTMSLQFR